MFTIKRIGEWYHAGAHVCDLCYARLVGGYGYEELGEDVDTFRRIVGEHKGNRADQFSWIDSGKRSPRLSKCQTCGHGTKGTSHILGETHRDYYEN